MRKDSFTNSSDNTLPGNSGKKLQGEYCLFHPGVMAVKTPRGEYCLFHPGVKTPKNYNFLFMIRPMRIPIFPEDFRGVNIVYFTLGENSEKL